MAYFSAAAIDEIAPEEEAALSESDELP